MIGHILSRRQAWADALALWDQYDRESNRHNAARGGYRDPAARDHINQLFADLMEIVTVHRFTGSYVDPLGLSWTARRATPRTYPYGD